MHLVRRLPNHFILNFSSHVSEAYFSDDFLVRNPAQTQTESYAWSEWVSAENLSIPL